MKMVLGDMSTLFKDHLPFTKVCKIRALAKQGHVMLDAL